MNRDKPEKIDKECNVCGSAIEVGSAWSRCSNRNCVTRDRDNNLGSGASDEEILEYWMALAIEAKKRPSHEEIDEAVEEAYKAFRNAKEHDTATAKNGAVKALLPLSTYDGFGDLRMEVDE